ncbi:Flp family type IVb pilin [Microvirga makkahensis]|uniref:Flp family type IVb pilin n=1 Tax=Microvirga makkahensis TaxID=1128670 RepID=A0A7X3SMS9_9HYPH|nr:Flp family type IVb pilin [Microvirga makkahensis]MXQ10682.1 Flp family type IVb pilin [Microvirga makkahensis]
MIKLITRFGKDQSGATAIEYGLIAGLIAVAIIGAVQLIGADLAAYFNNIATTLTPPAASS